MLFRKERSHRIGSGRVQVGERRSEKQEYESHERRGGGGTGRYESDWKDERYRRGDRRDGNSRSWVWRLTERHSFKFNC